MFDGRRGCDDAFLWDRCSACWLKWYFQLTTSKTLCCCQERLVQLRWRYLVESLFWGMEGWRSIEDNVDLGKVQCETIIQQNADALPIIYWIALHRLVISIGAKQHLAVILIGFIGRFRTVKSNNHQFSIWFHQNANFSRSFVIYKWPIQYIMFIIVIMIKLK